MSTRLILGSVVLGFMSLGVMVLAQAPASSDKPPSPAAAPSPKSPPKAMSIEERIQRAAWNDPEVKIAEAELQMARSKLDAARVAALRKLFGQYANVNESREKRQMIHQRLAMKQEKIDRLKAIVDSLPSAIKNNQATPNDLTEAKQQLKEAEKIQMEMKKELDQQSDLLRRLTTDWEQTLKLAEASSPANRVFEELPQLPNIDRTKSRGESYSLAQLQN